MVIDTSVLVAILFQEGERQELVLQIRSHPNRYVSAASVLETVIVYTKRKPWANPADVNELLDLLLLSTVPVTLEQLKVATEAFLRFGKGRHPAKLNFGDCFPYALAKVMDRPLLFKGNDFSETDVRPVRWRT